MDMVCAEQSGCSDTMNVPDTQPEVFAVHAGFRDFLLELLRRHGLGPFNAFLLSHRAAHYRFVSSALLQALRAAHGEQVASVSDWVRKSTPLQYLSFEATARRVIVTLPITTEGESHV